MRLIHYFSYLILTVKPLTVPVVLLQACVAHLPAISPTKDAQRIYVQVADEMYAEGTRERELAPLRSVRDAYPKMIVVRQGSYEKDIDGIRIIGAQEFFLRDWG